MGGNSGAAIITGVAVNTVFEAYITGYEEESCYSGGNPNCTAFPTVRHGAFMPGNLICDGCGNPYAFVAKFDAGGANLLYSSLYGSATPIPQSGCTMACAQNTTESNAIAVDAVGAAYITGWTQDGNLPVTPGDLPNYGDAYLRSNSDPSNYYSIEGERGFVAKFDPTPVGRGVADLCHLLGRHCCRRRLRHRNRC